MLSWLKFSCNLVSRACAQIAWQMWVRFVSWNPTFCIPESCLTSVYWGVAVVSDVVWMRLIPTRILGLLNRNWWEAREEIQSRLFLGSCCNKGEWEQVTNSLAHLLHKMLRATSLYRVRVEGVSRGQAGGWLRGFAHPLCGIEFWGHVQFLLLLLTPRVCPWLFRSGSKGFLVFLYPLSIMWPNCACMQLFLVPYGCFVFCCWKSGMSRWQQSRKGS